MRKLLQSALLSTCLIGSTVIAGVVNCGLTQYFRIKYSYISSKQNPLSIHVAGNQSWQIKQDGTRVMDGSFGHQICNKGTLREITVRYKGEVRPINLNDFIEHHHDIKSFGNNNPQKSIVITPLNINKVGRNMSCADKGSFAETALIKDKAGHDLVCIYTAYAY